LVDNELAWAIYLPGTEYLQGYTYDWDNLENLYKIMFTFTQLSETDNPYDT
jgi:hypothetical protein